MPTNNAATELATHCPFQLAQHAIRARSSGCLKLDL